jgi:DNA-binding NtrC family response regulator
VRELENVIERTVLLHRDEVLLPEQIIMEEVSEDGKVKGVIHRGTRSMKEMEQDLILRTLEELEGNRTHAAKALGISIRTLRNKLSDYKRQGGMQI